jgi:hypothetical protein
MLTAAFSRDRLDGRGSELLMANAIRIARRDRSQPINQQLVNIKRRARRRQPLLSGSGPAARTLADRQIQAADEVVHLLLSQSV